MFDRQIEETVEIVASASEVWWQLTNFEGYPEWNPFITSIRGHAREGERLTVTIDPDSMPSMTFRPKVLVAERERELRWRGRTVGLPNIFDGEHAFIIESVGMDRVRFRQCESFSGVLVPGALSVIEGRLRRSFRAMNEELRQRAEAAHATRQAAKAARQEQA
ncbi:MAG: SRPBCC domain-containing protein [Armatimonadia bacterium]|nr:SRPBCC domain-containing protein [Armatimonadia bacterium]